MKAILCKEYGPPEQLVYEDVPSEPLGAGEIRVAVRAAGVNFPDVLIIKGEYQFKPSPPFSPGAEVAGDVVEVGSAVSGFRVGDRVIASTGWNGFREEVVVGAERCLEMPPSMSYEDGAVFPMIYGTSYYALVQRGRLRPGETLLVLGATGGVGSSAVELGKVLGAKVIAAAGSDEKLEILSKRYPVDHVINYAKGAPLKDQVKALTGGAGADVIYDAVGGDLFDQSLRCINWDGRLLVIGFTGGIPQAKTNLVLLKGCSIVGVFWGAFTGREPEESARNFAELLRLYEAGKIRPLISHRFPLERAADALNAIVRREVVGKAVLTVG